jgi:hypothetical protein
MAGQAQHDHTPVGQLALAARHERTVWAPGSASAGTKGPSSRSHRPPTPPGRRRQDPPRARILPAGAPRPPAPDTRTSACNALAACLGRVPRRVARTVHEGAPARQRAGATRLAQLKLRAVSQTTCQLAGGCEDAAGNCRRGRSYGEVGVMSLMPAPEWHLPRREHGALAWRVWPGPDRLHIRQRHRVRLDRDHAGVDLVDE